MTNRRTERGRDDLINALWELAADFVRSIEVKPKKGGALDPERRALKQAVVVDVQAEEVKKDVKP